MELFLLPISVVDFTSFQSQFLLLLLLSPLVLHQTVQDVSGRSQI